MSEEKASRPFLLRTTVLAEPMTLDQAWEREKLPIDAYLEEDWRGEERGYVIPLNNNHTSWLPASRMEERGYLPYGTDEERLRAMQDSLKELDKCLVELYKTPGRAETETGHLIMDTEISVSLAWSKLETLLARMARERMRKGKEAEQ